MANRLKKLIVDRVDLVDAGANPDADIVLFKREEQTDVKKATFGEIQQTRETEEMIHDLYVMCMDLESAIFSSLYASGDRVAEVKTSISQFGDAVTALMDEMVKENPVAKHRREDVVAKLKTFVAPYLKEAEVAEVKKEETTPVVETVEKAIPEEFRKRLEDAERVAKEATDRIAKAEEAVAVEKAKREHVELCKRVGDELPNLPGTVDEKAAVLKLADGSAPLMTILKAANTAMAKAMAEVGTTTGTPESTSVMAEINKRADALIAAEPKLSKPVAIEKVLQADPALYTKYREQHRAASVE
jgi:hypothetical protein